MDNLVVNMMESLLITNNGELFGSKYFIDKSSESGNILYRIIGDRCFICVYLDYISKIDVTVDKIVLYEGEYVVYRILPNELMDSEELLMENYQFAQAMS